MTKKIFRMDEIEKILGIPRRTYYRWEAAGKVPKAKRNPMSNQRYWTKEDIDKLKKITGRA
ncbi:MAG TPA: MerR family transcriptional regulator [Candidatus Omnitrophota bacterium]|nr:MerR family transcriptional regulator [Candidatus Omnitrophota bacterium]